MLHRGSGGRRIAVVAALGVLGAGLIAPVVGTDAPTPLTREPVSAEVRSIPLSGISPDVALAADAAMASFDIHDFDPHVGSHLGLAPAGGEVHVVTAADEHDDHAQELETAVALTATDVDEFGLVGISSDAPLAEGTQILVRVREDEGWSAWQPLPLSEHGPDPESAEAKAARFGTEPLLTSGADGVQVRVDTPGGEAPEGAEVTLVDNPVTQDDAKLPQPRMAGDLPLATVQASTVSAPMPAIISRAEWGADESLRRGTASYSPTIKAAFVHHTTSTTNYSPEEAAQQVRNLYNWYVKGLKYSDMAYNFIVDRYGRIYEGRGGGVDKAVIGSHTAGFNDETFAVSALGNFQKDNLPPEQMAAVTDAISSVVAWKMAMNHRDPNGTTVLTSSSSAGTSKYAKGQQATAAVVGGHGDIGSTACPGKHLSAQLPAIRAAAGAKLGATMVNPAAGQAAWGSGDAVPITTWSNGALNWNISISNRCGTVVRSMSGASAAPGDVRIDWDKRDDAGNPVPPGAYVVTMNATSNGEPLYPWVGTGRVLATNESPPDPCGSPEAFTLTGAGYGHGVGLSQYGALAMAKAGYDPASIATFYYQGTNVAPVQDDMDIRVNIDYRKARIDVRSEALAGDGGGIEVNVGGNVVVGGPADEFQFSNEGGNVRATRITGGAPTDLGAAPNVVIKWAGTRDPGQAGGGATVVNVTNKGTSFDSPGHRFRYGFVEILPSAGSLNAVNVLRLHDEYLYGIAEVSSSWPDAALQVQAMAARTYALSKISSGVRGACDCHVDDGSGPYSDQSFAGFAKESGAKGERWVAAVNATHASPNSGNAILFNGAPITAFYSSSNGGFTHASRDAWGGDLPYVQAVADPWSVTEDNPNRAWSVTVPQAQMAQAFGVGEVFSLAITERYASSVPKTVVATLADGSQVTKSGAELRNALGLKSAYIQAIDGATGAALTDPGAVAAPPAPTDEQPEYETQVKMRTPTAIEPKALTSYTLKARVLPKKKGRMVWRQQLVDGAWKTVAKARTNSKGVVTFTTKKAWPPGTSTTERLLVVAKKQPIGVSEQLTVAITPSVAPRTVRLKTPQNVSAPLGSKVVIKARVLPKKKGLTVWRQAFVNGEWVTVDRAKTDARGGVSFRIKKATPAGASYTYRLVVIDRKQAAGASPEIIVTVN